MEENSCFLLSDSFPRDILVRFLKSMANAIGFRAHVVDQTGNAIIQSHEIRPDSNFCCYIRRKNMELRSALIVTIGLNRKLLNIRNHFSIAAMLD